MKQIPALTLKVIILAGATSFFMGACTTAVDQVSKSTPPVSQYANATPLDLRLSALPYPYPTKEFKAMLGGQSVGMVYMDIAAVGKQKGVVVLFHGKNFSSDYWAPTIPALTAAGYRVIAPDQIGFGKSAKPDVAYHFDDLAKNTHALLISLGIKKTAVIANSMGGMVGVRFARLYPQVVQKLVLENPLGLEDYSKDIPPQTNDNLLKLEMAQTEVSYRRFLQSYFPVWQPSFEQFVEVYVRVQKGSDYPAYAKTSVLTYQMIAEQPVVNDLPQLKMPVLLIIGQKDRTVFGRRFAPPEAVKSLGNFPELGRKAAQAIPNAKLIPLDNVGHIPHIEVPLIFNQAVVSFLNSYPR
ncbi:alpha/beta fold hydrolase [Polynucleobacter brandtiae]|uniref:Pimeloyl-ACP methyl ester carboxylesterase n=1 Tax=Polynucleobacter brandtiae TaxID=1938816 RepID=A0A2M8VYK3_9BURK|nr:alpha/beta hydrolase [Polynucleobacter brandtiae]PJI82946.1 pimeloyl-ACP methyl ester carboxylesterase [Polynucleobacter brandtiae]